ncbi:glycosyltransferase family 2 protein [Enterobacter hormaechei]|uniref:glycosyltransferase family 2 protein n=1 Tax=Enterobacter hormaechei TaxID=158836 RepID=UPI003023B646|nr:glycosyltransferase family 2 protein [Enterobacter hormaechei]
MKAKIFSIITTFNPEFSQLEDLIKILLKQTEMVIICNNSESNEGFERFQEYPNIHLINFGENLGIAKAQSVGMEWAFNNGAEFILQMDQDSTPHKDMVKQLMQCYLDMSNEGLNPGLIGVQDYDRFTGEVNKARVKKGTPINENYYDVDSTLSSGSLIPKKAWITVGGMRDDLFIDAVDHEYCWRLRHAGYKIIRNKNALLAHRLGDGRFKIMNFISVGMPSPFRHYYATRNIFLLMKEKHVPLFWKISSIVKLAGKVVFYPIFLPKGKDRLSFFIKGIRDGINGKSGILK